jgi:hypothetical protein
VPYSIAIAALYMLDYVITWWALGNLPHAAEANPMWPLAPVLTPAAVLALSLVAFTRWHMRSVRYALYAALAIVTLRLVNNVIVVAAGL